MKWECIENTEFYVERTAVPNGWLVRTSLQGVTDAGWKVHLVATTFVPDPEHTWTLEMT